MFTGTVLINLRINGVNYTVGQTFTTSNKRQLISLVAINAASSNDVSAQEIQDYLTGVLSGSVPAGGSSGGSSGGTGGSGGSSSGSAGTGSAMSFDQTDIGYDFVLAIGQSNMSGFGLPYDSTIDLGNPNVTQYSLFGSNAGRFIPYNEPLRALDVFQTNQRISPLGNFVKELNKSNIRRNREICVVPVAFPGASFSNNRQNPGDDVYSNIIRVTRGLLALNPKNRLLAALISIGETDVPGFGTLTKPTYILAIDTFINALRADLGVPNLPIMLGELVRALVNADSANRTPILEAQQELASRIPFTATVSSLGLSFIPTEINHHDANGQREWGRRFFDSLLALRSTNFSIPAPQAATNITVTNLLTTAVQVRWQQQGACNGWTVRIKQTAQPDSAYTIVPRVGDLTNPANITGLLANTNYTVQIQTRHFTSTNATVANATATFTTGTADIATAAPDFALDLTTNFNDSSGNARNGTATGVTIVPDPSGVRGNCASVPGGSNLISVNHAIGASYTKMLWVRLAANSTGNHNLIGGSASATVDDNHVWWISANGNNNAPAMFTLKGGHGNSLNMVWDYVTFPAEVWRHVAFTWNNTSRTGILYVEGKRVALRSQTTLAAVGTPAAPTLIGAFTATNTSMNGHIQRVKVWSSVLTDAQIEAIYLRERV